MSLKQCLLLSLGIIISLCAHAQTDPPQTADTASILSPYQSSKYLDIVSNKAGKLEQKLEMQSAKALRQMQKLEKRIGGKLAKLDSNKAKEIFGSAEQQYKELEQRLEKSVPLQQYISNLDTLKSSIKFLQQNPHLFSNALSPAGGGGFQQKLKDAMSKFSGMEGKFEKAEEIKKFLRARKEMLRKELSNHGFARELKKINKNVFYFNQQVQEYASLLKDHRRAERKVLELLSKSRLFKKFMQKHSTLASLFRLPGNPDDPANMANLSGLQSRASVTALIQNQLAAGGPGSQQQFQQNIAQAQSQLSKLKDKMNELGNSSSDDELPDFKVNNQRKKSSFWKKWEAGINMQSNRSNGVFPVSSDVGLSAGFRPHDNFVIGLGFAGRIGWGKSIRHIAVSYSGISARSFSELKIKGSFHAAAGFEMNYRPEIRDIEELKDYSAWQPSFLLGLSKVVSLKTKFFKKTKLQLLWDFMSYRQIPITQPIVFRIGYGLK